LIGSCGHDSAAPDAPSGSFTITAGADRVFARQGLDTPVTIQVDRAGDPGDIAVTVDGLAAIAALPLTIPAGETEGVLTLHADPAAPQGGPGKLSIIGSSSAGSSQTTLDTFVAGPPGTLDRSFGSSGITLVGNTTTGYAGRDLVRLADGSFVVGGNGGATHVMADGTLDSSFGTAGVAPSPLVFSFGMTVDGMGRILLVGGDGTPLDTAVYRLHADGTPDTTFGTGGLVTLAVSSGDDLAASAVVDSQGRIVLAGRFTNGSADAMVVRLMPDGSLDTGFGTGGKTVVATAGFDTFDQVRFRPDGRIVVTGSATFGTKEQVVVAQLDVDGHVDVTFASAGVAQLAPGTGDEEAYVLDFDATGGIVVAGGKFGGTDVGLLAHFNATGASYTAFGTSGVATLDLGAGSDGLEGVAVAADGSIVVAGQRTATTSQPLLARFSASGVLDPAFGTSGVTTLDFGPTPTSNDTATKVVLLGDDRIVVCGRAGNGGGEDFALARFWP
jgi:uncharacterized delta-60 repeat protein